MALLVVLGTLAYCDSGKPASKALTEPGYSQDSSIRSRSKLNLNFDLLSLFLAVDGWALFTGSLRLMSCYSCWSSFYENKLALSLIFWTFLSSLLLMLCIVSWRSFLIFSSCSSYYCWIAISKVLESLLEVVFCIFKGFWTGVEMLLLWSEKDDVDFCCFVGPRKTGFSSLSF